MMAAVSVLPRFCILLVLVAAGSALQAQTKVIKIRVINANNNTPIPKQNVSVSLLYEKGEKTPAKYDANLRLETDVNGEAQFSLPEPAPAHFAAQTRLTSENWHCKCIVIGTTQDLIQKGLVQPSGPESKGSATKVQPESGVIVFLARPFSFFERLIYPLIKE